LRCAYQANVMKTLEPTRRSALRTIVGFIESVGVA
jgi:hypothetical protein